MRLPQTALLLAATTLTAMAMTTASASAQEEPIEVINEASGEHCGAGNCVIHFEGSIVFTLHAFGSESQNSGCTDEFEAVLGEDGNGAITSYVNNAASSADCTKIMCNGVGEPAAESAWPITNFGEYAGTDGEGHFTLRFCLDEEGNPNAAGRHCNIELDFHDHPNHAYGFEAVNEECPIIGMTVWTEIDGQWESEAAPAPEHDDIEIIHAP